MLKVALFSIAVALVSYNWKLFIPQSWYEPGIGNINEFLLSHGYSLETHQVKTEDGYILSLHRIPYGPGDNSMKIEIKKPPVFLMHGLACSSMDWILKGPEKALALVLVDAGYDVWLGNNRGNTYSRDHVNLHPVSNNQEFFNYSYHEIGLYDLPAMIDYVLDTTAFEQLTYVGHSEGFTSFVVMCSLRPEYNQKILLMNAYAPVTNTYNVTSLIFNFFALSPRILESMGQILGHELFPHNMSPFLIFLCNALRPLCRQVFYILGISPKQFGNQEDLITILSHFPAGMSLKQITHYIQGTRTGIFGPFNYGKEKNLNLYGSPDPPFYNLTEVTAPIIIYYGENDNLVNNYILLNIVVKQLCNVIKEYLIPNRHFDHMDFLWGKNVSLLTEETLKNINQYNNR